MHVVQYLVRMGIHSRVLDMGDAIFANDYAAVMSEVGVREAVWTAWLLFEA
jgi:hypothetical protein